MNKESIFTEKAPKAIGPYSQGVKTSNMIFTSGQLPLDPISGEMHQDVKEATRRAILNVQAVLEAGGSSLDKVIKTMVFLKDMKDFADMNEVYSEFFGENSPARSCVQVAALPKDAVVEIEAIAIVD